MEPTAAVHPAGTDMEELLEDCERAAMYGEDLSSYREEFTRHWETLTNNGAKAHSILLRGAHRYHHYFKSWPSIAQMRHFALLHGSVQRRHLTMDSRGNPLKARRSDRMVSREIDRVLKKAKQSRTDFRNGADRVRDGQQVILDNIRRKFAVHCPTKLTRALPMAEYLISEIVRLGSVEVGASFRDISLKLSGASPTIIKGITDQLVEMGLITTDQPVWYHSRRYRFTEAALSPMRHDHFPSGARRASKTRVELADFADFDAVEPSSYSAAVHPFFYQKGLGTGISPNTGLCWVAIRDNSGSLNNRAIKLLFNISEATVSRSVNALIKFGLVQRIEGRLYAADNVDLDALMEEHGVTDRRKTFSEMYGRQREAFKIYRDSAKWIAQTQLIDVLVDRINKKAKMDGYGSQIRLKRVIETDQNGAEILIWNQSTGKVVYSSRQYEGVEGKWRTQDTGQATMMELASLAGFENMSSLFDTARGWLGDRYKKARALVSKRIVEARMAEQSEHQVRVQDRFNKSVDQEFDEIVAGITREDVPLEVGIIRSVRADNALDAILY